MIVKGIGSITRNNVAIKFLYLQGSKCCCEDKQNDLDGESSDEKECSSNETEEKQPKKRRKLMKINHQKT